MRSERRRGQRPRHHDQVHVTRNGAGEAETLPQQVIKNSAAVQQERRRTRL
jgi:hypothetical protein